MNIDTLLPMLLTVIAAATPLLLAAIGELVTEKSGVLNLGVEGMMLVGAVIAFAVTVGTGSAILGIIAAAFAGIALSLVFGLLTLTLMANQVATGLALTIFGIGVSSLIGSSYIGTPVEKLAVLHIPGLSDIPVLGPLLFGHDILVYASVAITVLVAWFLKSSRAGLILRAVGESDLSAHSIGYDVIKVRYLAVMFGGLCSGIAGAYLSLSYTPMWVEGMTAGRGWIALALVAFASWRPWRVLGGAYIFGGVTILQLYLQGAGGIGIPAQVMNMLPYLATIIVLTVISAGPWRGRLDAPACLGKPFRPAS
ncbi:ABC transporter permease [Zavarzinia aquatilis]|uniref:ABC transporter permease n=1 Tax=Zavarzinia aquatilis TaxID=2211142 RepID=A0A317EGH3_9PROT|nr:ABC transporter permease [Zavarzinia aquatilis]PWR25414.1 ABC transporter permease [Zavarzinia aquatilis]